MALRIVTRTLGQHSSNSWTRILTSRGHPTNIDQLNLQNDNHHHRTSLNSHQRLISTTCKNMSSDSAAYAGDGKTVVRVLNAEESPLNLVNTYSAKGFRLNNQLFIHGSIILFPTNVFAWNVQRGQDINVESLMLFDLIVPKVKIVIVGYGQKGEPYDASIPLKLKKKGISCEMLPTPNAVTTYNYLVNDSVHVAGAFVPMRQELSHTTRDEAATFGLDKMFGDLYDVPEHTPLSRVKSGDEKERHRLAHKGEDMNKKTFDK